MTQQRCSNSRQTRKVNAPMRILASSHMVVVNLHNLVFYVLDRTSIEWAIDGWIHSQYGFEYRQ